MESWGSTWTVAKGDARLKQRLDKEAKEAAASAKAKNSTGKGKRTKGMKVKNAVGGSKESSQPTLLDMVSKMNQPKKTSPQKGSG